VSARIGELRDEILILRKEFIPDGMGGHTEVEAPLINAWARVEAPRSKTGVIAQQDTEIRTHEITLRYVTEPEVGDVVEFLDERLVVQAVRHDRRRRWLYLDCVPEVR
jgi:SPP1 family predicted phage head-tail adaptor